MTEFDAKSIMEFADEFSSRVPERQLSHAEIQEYLIQRSHSPQATLGEFDLWLEQSWAWQEAERATGGSKKYRKALPVLIHSITGRV